MTALILMIALTQTDGGCLRDREGRLLTSGLEMGLSSLKRINDALDIGACDEAQRVLNEAVRCDPSPKKSMEPYLPRIERCRRNVTDAGKP